MRSSIDPKPVIEITSNKITYFWRLEKGCLEQEYIKNRKLMAQIAREKDCARSTMGSALKGNVMSRGSNYVARHAAGQVPFDFRVQRGQLVPHKGEQATISQMMALRQEGCSFGQIVDHLNSNGIPTKNRIRAWDRPTVYKILKRSESSRLHN